MRKIVRKERRARQTNGQKWTKEKGTNGLVRRVRATAERRTKGTRVKVVTGDREEASSKVMLRLRKPAIRDVISVLLYPTCLFFFTTNAYSLLCFVSINIIDIDEPFHQTI